MRGLVDEALDRGVVGDVGELLGHRRRRHRRLLGRDREVQDLDQDERGRVAQAGREAAPERAERDRAERELDEGRRRRAQRRRRRRRAASPRTRPGRG